MWIDKYKVGEKMSNRSARHTRRLEATKEFFEPCIGGSEYTGIGLGMFGYLIDLDTEFATVGSYVPWDFRSLIEAAIMFVPVATFLPGAAMTVRVILTSPSVGQWYGEHNVTVDYAKACTINRVEELDITAQLDGALLQTKNYIGGQVIRQAGQNTNAYIMGLRIKYRVAPGGL